MLENILQLIFWRLKYQFCYFVKSDGNLINDKVTNSRTIYLTFKFVLLILKTCIFHRLFIGSLYIYLECSFGVFYLNFKKRSFEVWKTDFIYFLIFRFKIIFILILIKFFVNNKVIKYFFYLILFLLCYSLQNK